MVMSTSLHEAVLDFVVMNCLFQFRIFFPNWKVLPRIEILAWEVAQDSFLKTAVLFYRWLPIFHKAKSGEICIIIQYLIMLLSFRISTKACLLPWNLHPQILKSIFSHFILFVAVEIILYAQHALWFPSCTLWDGIIE